MYTSLFYRFALSALFIFTILSVGFTAYAQTPQSDKIYLGFLYPISTHGTHAPQDTNIFSFNILGGVSAGERGLAFAGISNVVRSDARGISFAGFSNHIGKKSEGLLFAGFINTYSQAKGMQFAGFSNISKNQVEGAQFAGFLNKASNVKGAQLAGFSNLGQDVDGSQFAGFINIAKEVKGSQLAGFINKAGNVSGSQLAGFINIAKKVKGAQIAGFINIADSSDCPLGLINLIKKGEKGIRLSTDDNLTTLLSFQSGGKTLYGLIGLGYNFMNDNDVYAFEAGLGAHFFSSKSFRLNTEIAVVTLQNFKEGGYFKSSFRLLPALKVTSKVEIFGGPAFNYINTDTSEGRSLTKHYISTWENQGGDNFQGLYIGYTGGLHILF